MMNKPKPLPALIEGWIASLNDQNSNIHIRDNYCAMLENVRDKADEAIKQFNMEKNRLLQNNR